MNDQGSTDNPPHREAITRRWLASAALLGAGLFCAAVAFWVFPLLMLDPGYDRPIFPERALAELDFRLKEAVNVTLDPEARIVASHERRGGIQGDGSSWYLAEMPAAALERFEESFHQTYRTPSGRMVPFGSDRPPSFMVLEGLGTGGVLPVGSRPFWLSLTNETCAIFFDNKFYFYLDQ